MGIWQNITNIFKKNEITAEIITGNPGVSNDNYRIINDSEGAAHLIPTSNWKSDMKMSEIKSFPLINDPMVAFAGSGVVVHPYGVPTPVSYDVLWSYFKYTPEVVAVVRAIVEDIMSDGFLLKGGRNNRIKAEKFLMENFFKDQIASMLFDVMVTGDGYLYTQKLTNIEVKSIIDRVVNMPEIKSQIPDEIKHEVGNKIFDGVDIDEDLFTPRSFINVASSTMKANFDQNGNIINWIQKVGVKFQTYTPEEIAHFRLYRLDGKFYGFTPLVSILKDMDILANVKDYARYFFEKGGVPNYLFIMENETPQSQNYRNFQKTLQLFASLANKYKNMVVTGKVEAHELNKMSKDMEFRELAKYLSGVIIMAWGVPVSRLSDVGLGDKVATKGSTISTEGYYRKISHIQDLLADFLNMFILSKFKVTMEFKKTYKQDEVREVQVDKVKTDTVEQRMSLGLMTREGAAEYLGIDPEDLPSEAEWTKLKNKLAPKMGGTSVTGQSKLNNHQLLSDNPDKLADDSEKQKAATFEKKSRTVIKRLSDDTFEVVE